MVVGQKGDVAQPCHVSSLLPPSVGRVLHRLSVALIVRFLQPAAHPSQSY